MNGVGGRHLAPVDNLRNKNRQTESINQTNLSWYGNVNSKIHTLKINKVVNVQCYILHAQVDKGEPP